MTEIKILFGNKIYGPLYSPTHTFSSILNILKIPKSKHHLYYLEQVVNQKGIKMDLGNVNKEIEKNEKHLKRLYFRNEACLTESGIYRVLLKSDLDVEAEAVSPVSSSILSPISAYGPEVDLLPLVTYLTKQLNQYWSQYPKYYITYYDLMSKPYQQKREQLKAVIQQMEQLETFLQEILEKQNLRNDQNYEYLERLNETWKICLFHFKQLFQVPTSKSRVMEQKNVARLKCITPKQQLGLQYAQLTPKDLLSFHDQEEEQPEEEDQELLFVKLKSEFIQYLLVGNRNDFSKSTLQKCIKQFSHFEREKRSGLNGGSACHGTYRLFDQQQLENYLLTSFELK